jgi:hypothetical protein
MLHGRVVGGAKGVIYYFIFLSNDATFCNKVNDIGDAVELVMNYELFGTFLITTLKGIVRMCSAVGIPTCYGLAGRRVLAGEKICSPLLLGFIQPPDEYREFFKTPWSESASELYRPSDRRLSAK